MTYLVDSDILISAAGGRVDAQQILNEISDDGLAISIISLGELYEGAVGSPDPDESTKLARLRAYLHAFPILNLSDPVMERFARLLATNNPADYNDLPGLLVETPHSL